MNINKFSKAATIIIFLALIRCISETFRLYYITTNLGFNQFRPFLIGALICSVSLLIMTLLAYWQKHKLIIALAAITIVLLLVVKGVYL